MAPKAAAANHHPDKPSAPVFRLPPTLSGPADVARLARELESLESYMYQAGLRHKGEAIKLPKMSRAIDDLAQLNKLELLKPEDRKKLGALLTVLHTKAPVMHISFSVEPSAAFVAKLVNWLRENINPFVLVTIGKQPTIGGGCVVRTTNKQFDFSFRQYLQGHRGDLSNALAEVAKQTKAAAS